MNKVLIINKPINYTSRDVVNVISKHYQTKKVGHTGTLDPLATGVLVILVGQYTKLTDLITAYDKEYVATMQFGIKTDTGDITGKIIEKQAYDLTNLKQVIASMVGTYEQTVPAYSAIKINGKKLYQYARHNEEVTLPTRMVTIKEIELLESNKEEVTFRVIVSKGTYIRSLIEDIATKLNTVATMTKLMRTKQGQFDIKDSYQIEDVLNNECQEVGIKKVLSNFQQVDIDDSLYEKIINGQIIPKNGYEEQVCFFYHDELVAIYQTYDKDISLMKPKVMCQ